MKLQKKIVQIPLKSYQRKSYRKRKKQEEKPRKRLEFSRSLNSFVKNYLPIKKVCLKKKKLSNLKSFPVKKNKKPAV
jgi:hypothetical protein